MAKQKLNFRFHNPNTAEATADYILKMFIEASKEKVEQAMRDAAEVAETPPISPAQPEPAESHSARMALFFFIGACKQNRYSI